MLDDRTQLHFPAHGLSEVALDFAAGVVRCTAAGPGGRPLVVLLDTGTDPSVIDLRLARQLGLRLGGFALGSDAVSDSVPFTETVLPWLRLGELTLRDLYLLAVDLSAAPFAVDLVLGYNVLSHLTLAIDYAAGTIGLAHPDLGPPLPTATGRALPLTFVEHFPALTDVQIVGGGSLPLATIDTGSNSGLTLGPDLAHQFGLRAGAAEVLATTGSGFVAARTVLTSTLAGLQLGPFTLPNIAVDAPGSGAGDFGRMGRANLGNGLFARFARLALDYRRGLCVLDPRRDK